MPQLDIIIIFPQIFWFFLLFISFYSILIHFVLPKIAIILKSRKLIILNNTNEIFKITKKSIDNSNRITKWIKKSLIVINNIFKVDTLHLNKMNINSKIDFKISLIIQELILYYNKHTLNVINLYHKNFNYKE